MNTRSLTTIWNGKSNSTSTNKEGQVSVLEILHPRPQFHFPSPRAAMLSVDMHIGLRNRIRLQRAVLSKLRGSFVAWTRVNTSIYHEMRDMHVLRRQFSSHALTKTAKPKLTHREGR